MRYFLPLVDPWCTEYEYWCPQAGSRELVLDKMPSGFTPGEYVFCIVSNMQRERHPPKHAMSYQIVKPRLSLSTLVNHVVQYAQANGWGEDDAENTMRNVVCKAPRIAAQMVCDLEHWPFSGDQCFLRWTTALVEQNMIMVIKNAKRGNISDEEKSTDINACTLLGRWFAQREYLWEQAQPIVQALVHYVGALGRMTESDFVLFSGTRQSGSVLRINTGPAKGVNISVFGEALVNLPTPVCSIEGATLRWSESGLGAFVLGMAWEMRSQGNALAFERANFVLNKRQERTSEVLSQMQWEDSLWREQAMLRAVKTAQLGLGDIVQNKQGQGLLDFYPPSQKYHRREQRSEDVLQLCKGHPSWAHAMVKMTLAGSLHETFAAVHHYSTDAQTQLLVLTPLLQSMEPQARNALFMEMVQTLASFMHMDTRSGLKKDPQPWTTFAQAAHNAWQLTVSEEEGESKSVVEYFVDWLAQWQHPFEHDMRVLCGHNVRAASLGTMTTNTRWINQ